MSDRRRSSASPANPLSERSPHPGRRYRAVVMGASAGGLQALTVILGELAPDFSMPILLAQHLHAADDGAFAAHLGQSTKLIVVDPRNKEPILPGHMYVAPANYHMLVEKDESIALTIDERVNHSRPSIDVLFESAAHGFGSSLVAVILSGANQDGARGMCTVMALGGLGIAQDPESALFPLMPLAAIAEARLEIALPPEGIARKLSDLSRGSSGGRYEQAGPEAGECK